VLESGDENTRTAVNVAANTHLALDTQEASKQAIVSLLLPPPGSMVRSPVIPLSQTLT